MVIIEARIKSGIPALQLIGLNAAVATGRYPDILREVTRIAGPMPPGTSEATVVAGAMRMLGRT